MDKGFDGLVLQSIKSNEQGFELMGKMIDVARPEAVYAEPVVTGEYTVITASEVTVGMGFGFGAGGGSDIDIVEVEDEEADSAETVFLPDGSMGGGGGGGGGSMGRPVAVISVGPNGVHVEPVVDVTKIGLALFTALGAMFMFAGRMRRLK